MKKKLYLITTDFPYGEGEASFIMPELPYLKEFFDITIISNSLLKEIKNNLSSDIEVIHYERRAALWRKVFDSICYFFNRDAYQEILEILRQREKIFGRIFESILFFEESRRFRRFLLRNKIIDQRENIIIYCYWYTYYCYTMTKLFQKNKNIKIVSRTHRYDLYDEGTCYGRQPFKRQMEKRLDYLIFISEHGRKYYSEKYAGGVISKKYQLFYLGVEGARECNKKEKTGEFRIVSCSAVIQRKRVELIVDALSKITDFPIRWIHFGNGAEYKKLCQYACSKLDKMLNIKYELRGYVPSDKIVEYYSQTYVDVFITTSESEGCPVSVQEAMSCGIPIIGTAVGEIPNMISQNGIILSENPDAVEIAAAIRKIYNMNEQSVQAMRRNSYYLWKEKFNSEINSKKFAKFLGAL